MPKILHFQDFRLAQGPHGSPEAPGPPGAGTAPAALPGVPAPRQAGARGCRQRGRHGAQGQGGLLAAVPASHPAPFCAPPSRAARLHALPLPTGFGLFSFKLCKTSSKTRKENHNFMSGEATAMPSCCCLSRRSGRWVLTRFARASIRHASQAAGSSSQNHSDLVKKETWAVGHGGGCFK